MIRIPSPSPHSTALGGASTPSMPPMRSRRSSMFGAVVAAAACALVLFFAVVKCATGPLVGKGDVHQYEYCGYYLLTHVTFRPVPHLSFDTTDIFYPYGTNAALQTWGLERDCIVALCL